MTIKCSKHPDYKAQRPPRVQCFGCYMMWLAKKFPEQFDWSVE